MNRKVGAKSHSGKQSNISKEESSSQTDSDKDSSFPETANKSDLLSEKKHEKKRKHMCNVESTSDSDDRRSCEESLAKKRRLKKKDKKEKKHRKKLKKLKKKKKKKKAIDKEKHGAIDKDDTKKQQGTEKASFDPKLNISDVPEKPKRSMVPMTKEEYEKQQSVVRRVYDPDTGRNRLIKGDGEVIEEIVSFSRQKEINKQATRGDAASFQRMLGLNERD